MEIKSIPLRKQSINRKKYAIVNVHNKRNKENSQTLNNMPQTVFNGPETTQLSRTDTIRRSYRPNTS